MPFRLGLWLVTSGFGGSMELSRIKALIDLLASSAVTELELSEGPHRIRLSKATPKAATPTFGPPVAGMPHPPRDTPTPSDDQAITIVAPMFGVVHLSSAPAESPFVSPGQSVKAGQTVCLIEAMKVLSAVVSDTEAVVEAVLATDGQEVETGQPLFRLGRQ